MKINRILQSVFFALALIGVFASMARNAYGFTYMGISCFCLALLYFVQLIWKVIEDHSTMETKEIPGLLESFLLSCLLLLFGLRAFYIRLPYSDFIFISLCVLLLFVYSSM